MWLLKLERNGDQYGKTQSKRGRQYLKTEGWPPGRSLHGWTRFRDRKNDLQKYPRQNPGVVKEQLNRAIEETAGLGIVKARQYTVGQWMDVWFDNYAKIKVRLSSHQTYWSYIDNHIKPNIGSIPLSKLSSLDFAEFYKKLLSGGRIRTFGLRVMSCWSGRKRLLSGRLRHFLFRKIRESRRSYAFRCVVSSPIPSAPLALRDSLTTTFPYAPSVSVAEYVVNNPFLSRFWFRGKKGLFSQQNSRFLTVALLVLLPQRSRHIKQEKRNPSARTLRSKTHLFFGRSML